MANVSRPLSMMRRCLQVQPEMNTPRRRLPTPGVAMAVSPTLWTTLCYDLQIKPTAEMEDVEKPGADQYMPSEIGARTGEATFKIRPTAPSANPAWAMALLPGFGLGWNGSTAFVLDQTFPETVGSTVQTLSLFAWEDGILKSIYGSAGMLRISGTAGKTAIFDCTYRGKWAAAGRAGQADDHLPDSQPAPVRGRRDDADLPERRRVHAEGLHLHARPEQRALRRTRTEAPATTRASTTS